MQQTGGKWQRKGVKRSNCKEKSRDQVVMPFDLIGFAFLEPYFFISLSAFMDTQKVEEIIRSAGFCPINVTAATISPHRSLPQRAEYLRKRLFLTAKRPKDVIILEYNKVTAHLLPPAADDSSRGLVATMYMDSAHVLRGVYQWTKEAAILAYVKPRTCQLRADKTGDETRLCNRPGTEIICETCGFTTCKTCYDGTRKRLQCLVCPKPECLVFATAGDMDVSIIRGVGDTHADIYMLHQRSIDQDQLSAETSLPIRVLVHPASSSATKSRIGTGANLLKDTAIQMYLTRPVRKFNVAVVTSTMGKKTGQTGFFDDPSSTFDFLRKQDTLFGFALIIALLGTGQNIRSFARTLR